MEVQTEKINKYMQIHLNTQTHPSAILATSLLLNDYEDNED